MKAIRSAQLNQQNWKQELYRFLRQYRTTPHVSTGQTPHRLLFTREPRTKLPQVAFRTTEPEVDEAVRVRDSQAKYTMKQNADVKDRAVTTDIKIGDSVLVKKEERGNKLKPPFDPIPKIVTAKKGPMITVDNSVTRNASRFKKIGSKVSENLLQKSSVPTEESIWPEVPNKPEEPKSDVPDPGIVPKKPAHSPVLRRSGRERKISVKFKDYVQ